MFFYDSFRSLIVLSSVISGVSYLMTSIVCRKTEDACDPDERMYERKFLPRADIDHLLHCVCYALHSDVLYSASASPVF